MPLVYSKYLRIELWENTFLGLLYSKFACRHIRCMLEAMEGGNMLKAGGSVLLVLLLFFLSVQIYSFVSQTNKTEREYAELQNKLKQAKEDQNKFVADMDYYLNPENLKKELKGRFNYREPGEKMLILVNKGTSSLVSSSTPQ